LRLEFDNLQPEIREAIGIRNKLIEKLHEERRTREELGLGRRDLEQRQPIAESRIVVPEVAANSIVAPEIAANSIADASAISIAAASARSAAASARSITEASARRIAAPGARSIAAQRVVEEDIDESIVNVEQLFGQL